MAEIDEHLAVLATKTGRSVQSWSDTLTLPEPIRTETLAAWADDDWVQDPDRFGQVMAVVNLLESVAGAVTGLAGAGSAVAALRAAL